MSLARKAVIGAAWNLFTGFGARIVGLVGTLMLTHFLTPDEYGSVSAAAVCVMTFGMFGNVNFGQYVIAKGDSGPDVAFHAFVFHLILGTCAMLPVFVFGGWLEGFTNTHDMLQYLPGLAVSHMIERIGYIPERTIVRDLRFRQVAIIRGLSELSFTATSLLLAKPIGAMCIVAGNIVRYSIGTVGYIVIANRKDWLVPSKFSAETTKALFGYGVPISLGNLADFAARWWDNLLMAKFHGQAQMSLYNQAYNLAETPTGHVAEHIGDVLLPSFAKLPEERRADAFVRASALLALIVFPLAVGLGAVADTAVAAAFNSKWAGIAPMLVVLSALSVVRPVSWTAIALLQAQRRSRLLMILGFFKAVTLIVAIVTVGRISPMWLCLAASLAYALHSFATLVILKISDGIPVLRTVIATLPPLIACIPIVAAVLGVRYLLSGVHIETRAWQWTALILEVLAGGIAYAVGALLLAKKSSRDFLGLIKDTMRRRRGGGEEAA